MNPIPATTEALLDQIRALGSFSSWSGSSTLTVEQIKTYCVPGNAKQAKGRMAIWVRGPAAKRPRILLPELVMLAMRFIAEPKRRGKRGYLDPGSFSMSVTGKEAKLPGVWNNNEIYLALARRLLGLPDDHEDETTKQVQAEAQERWNANHPDIRAIDGLMREVLIAYMEARSWYEVEEKGRDWTDLCYRTLRSRQGSMAWMDQEERHRADLAAVLDDIRTNPVHADIRDIDIAVFAMLYTQGLCMAGKIKASAVTTVVNRLADAADGGMMAEVDKQIEHARAASSDWFAEILRMRKGGRRSR